MSARELISSAMVRVSGRTVSTSPSASSAIPAAASQGTVSTSASTCLPENMGLNTAGPSTAPSTAPDSTYEMPRARRAGAYMSPAAARISSEVAMPIPIRMNPRIRSGVEPAWVAAAVSAQPPACAAKPVASTGRRP